MNSATATNLDYSRWLADLSGYVINIERTYNPRDARLHATYCETITGLHTRGHFHRRQG